MSKTLSSTSDASCPINHPKAPQASPSALIRSAKLLNCGFTSGLLQAALFNPWDRALYLSVRYHRPFLHIRNFSNPFAGVFQTLFQRAVSSGVYFPLEQLFAEGLHSKLSVANEGKSMRKFSTQIHFVAGLLAGATNGIIMNPFTSVKVN